MEEERERERERRESERERRERVRREEGREGVMEKEKVGRRKVFNHTILTLTCMQELIQFFISFSTWTCVPRLLIHTNRMLLTIISSPLTLIDI